MDLDSIIRAVQSRLRVPVDGQPGPVTWKAIAEHLGISTAVPRPPIGTVDPRRERIIAIARGCQGWKEATGHNDGPKIDDILASCGLRGSKQPYCGAFNRFVYDKAGLAGYGPKPKDAAWSPNWVEGATWTQRSGGMNPRPGDTFGIWFKAKGRVAHTGLILEWGGETVLTIEGNTSADAAVGTDADREGQGVFMRRRETREIYAVRNWIDGV